MYKVRRSFDSYYLEETMSPFMKDAVGFEPVTLLKDSRTVLLVDDKDNFGLFEYDSPGIYYGHYLFGSARGRKAFSLAKEMLTYFFKQHPVEKIYGETPIDHSGALGLTTLLGFEEVGVEETEAGPMVLSVLTKEGFLNNE